MIHTDYSELFIDLISNGLDMSKYNSVVNNIIDNTTPTPILNEAIQLLIEMKVKDTDRYIKLKIGAENYNLISELTNEDQIYDLKTCETYLTLMYLRNIEVMQLEDGYQSQSDDYISLTKGGSGILSQSRLMRDSDSILRRWYCES